MNACKLYYDVLVNAIEEYTIEHFEKYGLRYLSKSSLPLKCQELKFIVIQLQIHNNSCFKCCGDYKLRQDWQQEFDRNFYLWLNGIADFTGKSPALLKQEVLKYAGLATPLENLAGGTISNVWSFIGKLPQEVTKNKFRTFIIGCLSVALIVGLPGLLGKSNALSGSTSNKIIHDLNSR